MQTDPLSDGSSRKKRERKPKVSFARDIRPLFRAVDISHMKVHGIKLTITPSCRIRAMLTKCLEHFSPRAKATRLPCHPAGPIGPRTSSCCSPQWQKDGDRGR